MPDWILAECLRLAIYLGGGCPPDAGAHALFRGSPTDASMVIYVATFDEPTLEPGGNAINCANAARLFQNQPRVAVRWWCESTSSPGSVASWELTCSSESFAWLFLMGPGPVVSFVAGFDTVEGDLETTPEAYHLSFAGSAERFAMRLRVNRYTGEGDLEFGEEPFFEYREGNVRYVISCSATSTGPAL